MKAVSILLPLIFAIRFAQCQNNIFQDSLPNGFKILVFENNDQPLVFGAVVVRAGSKHDPADATGMAHYLEHMLFKGTQTMGTTNFESEKIWLDSITFYYNKLSNEKNEDKRLAIQLHINKLSIKASEYAIANEIDKLLAEIGSTGVNAYTMVESTVYHNVFPSHQLEKWMAIYSARFQQPVFRLFQSELETVYEEKNRKSDDIGSSIFDYYLKHFFKNHPYGQQTTIGKTEHLKNPSLTKMYEFFNSYYVPNNMALVIAGNVNHDSVFALAKKYFSAFVRKTLPVGPIYNEKEFNGKEVLKIRRTPVKAGVIGYRLPSNKNPDMITLRVIAQMIANNSSSGSINRLVNNDKILMAGLEYMPYNDGGAAFLYFVPKIFGQSLKSAEKLVLNCINEIKEGTFTDEDLNRAKNYILKVYDASFENNTAAATNLINAYIKGIEPIMLFEEQNAIRLIERKQIISVAKKYFGNNYLAMYSRMGFVKKDKIKKPPYTPVIPKNELPSAFANEWHKLKSGKPVPRYVDFEKEIDSVCLSKNTWILKSDNPVNNIVSVTLTFGAGIHKFPILKYLPEYLMGCGTKTIPLNDFKNKLQELACDMSINATLNRFSILINVPEENLEKSLELIHQLIINPQTDKKLINHVAKETWLNYKVDKRSVEYCSKALNEFALYGKNSFYLNHMPLKEFKKNGLKLIKPSLDSLYNYGLRISYVGKTDIHKIINIFKSTNWISERKSISNLYIPPMREFMENNVYLFNKRNSRQTQVYLLKQGSPFQVHQAPVINAFNKYFGGDMSSIMFQEVREFRSLAYATFASYQSSAIPGIKSVFTVYAGTQNDKAGECLQVINNLVNNMPKKEERFESVKNSLLENAVSGRPTFRQLISTVLNWRQKGFINDPNIENYKQYSSMEFQNLIQFYETSIQNQKQYLCVTGKLKKLNSKELASYGKIKKVKRKEIMHL